MTQAVEACRRIVDSPYEDQSVISSFESTPADLRRLDPGVATYRGFRQPQVAGRGPEATVAPLEFLRRIHQFQSGRRRHPKLVSNQPPSSGASAIRAAAGWDR